MAASVVRRWLPAAVLVAGVYLAVGLGFGALAGAAADDRIRSAWRLAAFVVSAAVFLAHLGYEHFRLRNTPGSCSLHATAAVALGAFGLAAAANLHSHDAALGHRLLLALLLWPVVTALPAFLVASTLTTLVAGIERARRSR